MRTALGGEGDAGRRADQDRLAAAVDAERPGLERAGDERVVERADREQRLAPPAPGRAELAEQADEVDLGDAELDVLAGRALIPVQDRLGVVGEPVALRDRRPDAGLVDPAAEVRARSDIGCHGHDAAGGLRREPREVEQQPAERLLRRAVALHLSAEVLRHGGRRDLGDRRALQALRDGRAREGLRRTRREGTPRVVHVLAELVGDEGELIGLEQVGVVLRVPGARQPVALDRVGEDHGRSAVVDSLEGVDESGDVVAAEAADDAG